VLIELLFVNICESTVRKYDCFQNTVFSLSNTVKSPPGLPERNMGKIPPTPISERKPLGVKPFEKKSVKMPWKT
jgi:hypothetical protein